MQRFDINTGQYVDDSMSMFSGQSNGYSAFSANTNDALSNSQYGLDAASIGVDVTNPTSALGNSTGLGSTASAANQSGGMFDNFAGNNGWGNTAVAGASALANSWLGFENLGVAKDQYNLEKEQYNYNKTNYDDALARKASALANS